VITTNELRRIATRSGARQIRNVEIDVILTLLLQMFYERGLLEHLAFKGGTMLRKMVFGPRGRLSTDLDFTLNSEISRDDIMMASRAAGRLRSAIPRLAFSARSK
jgi:predicted nucleotidyltransferase component of viral defense system